MIEKGLKTMSTPIYFSKVEFRDRIGYGNTHSSILLNVAQRELSYQVYEWKKQMPAILREESYEVNNKTIHYSKGYPAKKVRSGSNGFKPELLPDEQYIQSVAFSYALKLSEVQMKHLLPYCNALDFEPYRDRKISMNHEGYIGYRDEISLSFIGITDSYIPKMEWEMQYYYDEKHMWSSEKLYRYLVLEYFQGNKKLKGWNPINGGLSLFF
ncbi:MAG: hypothetical protein Q4A19_00420 [Johnsonella sp.]|nr:hypothetical protein [Johnsonella sp.]